MARARRLTIAVAAVGMLISAAAGAQEYPTKPITLIVPWPAGGSTDISMRAIAESASKLLGQPIAGMGGIKLTQVPFKGGAETNAAVLGQHTMLQADSTGWRPLVDAGKLRLLMVWTSARSPNYPDVPTLKELGYPMVYDSPFGIAGPKGMDPKIVAKLHDAFKKALDDPAVIATLAKFDMVPNYKNTEDYKKFVVEVTESERKVIDKLGLAKKTN